MMTGRSMHRAALAIGALLAALAASAVLAGGAAARAHHPHCGYGVHVVAGYQLHLHMQQTSGVFGIYLLAPQPNVGAPNGSICIHATNRHNLPLDSTAIGSHRSRMDIVRGGHSIFRGLGLHPQLFSNGVVITFLKGTLAAIEQCPSCYRFEVWPLGYRGGRPELSGKL